MGIQVGSTEDVLAKRQEWVDAGLVTRDEMQTNCCYATQDKTWVHDPDGNEWEVFVVLQDNLPETAACECGTSMAEVEVAAPVISESSACCAHAPIGIGQ